MKAVRAKQWDVGLPLLGSALSCGFGFTGIKVFEYGEILREGITLTTNDFFMYYFVLTGIHFLHLLIGMGVLFYMANHVRTASPGRVSLPLIEGGACYWHMVDLLWIVLFPLIYLVK